MDCAVGESEVAEGSGRMGVTEMSVVEAGAGVGRIVAVVAAQTSWGHARKMCLWFVRNVHSRGSRKAVHVGEQLVAEARMDTEMVAA